MALIFCSVSLLPAALLASDRPWFSCKSFTPSKRSKVYKLLIHNWEHYLRVILWGHRSFTLLPSLPYPCHYCAVFWVMYGKRSLFKIPALRIGADHLSVKHRIKQTLKQKLGKRHSDTGEKADWIKKDKLEIKEIKMLQKCWKNRK